MYFKSWKISCCYKLLLRSMKVKSYIKLHHCFALPVTLEPLSLAIPLYECSKSPESGLRDWAWDTEIWLEIKPLHPVRWPGTKPTKLTKCSATVHHLNWAIEIVNAKPFPGLVAYWSWLKIISGFGCSRQMIAAHLLTLEADEKLR